MSTVAVACINHNVGDQISNSESISVLYATVHMTRYILDAESANFETLREGGGKPKQRGIDTTSVVGGSAPPTSTPDALPSVRVTIQAGVALSCWCPGVREL